MNLLASQCRGSLRHCSRRIPLSSPPFRTLVFVSRRSYATERQNFDFSTSGSSRIANALDGKSHSEQKHESVGPFQLGLSQEALRAGQKQTKWSQLSTKGKVRRGAERVTNLTVILFGAGISALLIYSLTSELFSKNSATVLYGDACDRIKASPKVAKYLNGPLTFHNNPPSSNRPRHRNRHVTHQVIVDSNGIEHMILSFYVKGSAEGDDGLSNLSYVEQADAWIRDKFAAVTDIDIANLNLDDATKWTKDKAEDMWDKTKQAFKYVSGVPVNTKSAVPPPTPEREPEVKKSNGIWDFVGVFSGLRGATASSSSSSWKEDDRKFTDGDVHADLIRNKDGYFVFRYLLVDIPSTRDSNPIRIFVERAPGVRENEPVRRWVSSS